MPPPHNTSGESGRSNYLDGVRGLAILLTILHHFFLLDWWTAGEMNRTFLRLTAGLFCGVDIFFALSGYFITTNLMQDASLKRFYLKRFFRIVPNYYLWAVLSLLTTVLLDRSSGQWLADLGGWWTHYFLFLNNYTVTPVVPGVSNLQVSWSLCIEEHFYLCWPLLFLALCKAPKNERPVVALIGLGALIMLKIGTYPLLGEKVYTMTHFRLDGLLVGCLAALWNAPLKSWLSRAAGWAQNLFVTLALSAILAVSFWFPDQDNRLFTAMLHLFYASMTCVIILLERPGSLMTQVLSLRWLAWMGRISYSVYLYHFFALVLLKCLHQRLSAEVQEQFWLGSALLYLTGSFGLGFLAHRWVEEPSMRARKKLLKRHPVRVPTW